MKCTECFEDAEDCGFAGCCDDFKDGQQILCYAIDNGIVKHYCSLDCFKDDEVAEDLEWSRALK